MASEQCSRHPEEKLRFKCTRCSMPICRDCKLTRHEGHPTTDLVPVTSSDLRQKLSLEKEEVEKCLKVARLLRDKARSSEAALERTAEETKKTMNKKVEAVVEWAKTYRLAMEKKMGELKQQAKREVESALEYLEENVDYLDQVNVALGSAVDGQVSEEQVARLCADYEQHHKGRYPDVGELSVTAAGHSWKVAVASTCPDQCQAAIERYLGLPILARVLKPVPPTSTWVFISKVPPGDNPGRVVSDILPMKDGSVSVLCRDSESSAHSTLTRYSPDGLKRMEQVVRMGEVVMMEPESCQLALFSVSSETLQPATQCSETGPRDTDEQQTTVVYLRHEPNNNNIICEVTYPEAGQPLRSIVVVYMDVQDAVRVASDASRRYFAVLRSCGEVKVYERHGRGALSTLNVRTELDQARLRDLCFGRVHDQEVLLVADSFYNVILIVNHLDGCVVTFFIPLPSPCPCCVRVDVTGSVWVGCEGGEVVVGCSATQDDDDDADVEEDDEGYLVPSDDLYVNIKALNPCLPLMDTSSDRSSSSGLPALPPKPDSLRSAETDQLGMPLRPPTRRPPSGFARANIHNLAHRRAEQEKAMSPHPSEEPPALPPAKPQAIHSLTLPQHSKNKKPDQLSALSDGEPCGQRLMEPHTSAIVPRSHLQKEHWEPTAVSEAAQKPPKARGIRVLPKSGKPRAEPKSGDQNTPPKPALEPDPCPEPAPPKRPPKPVRP